MDRARAFAVIAVATAFHLLAASAELALTLAGHQQPAAPATDDQDAAAMAGERLPFVAAHHLASWVHTPLPWVGSGPGADGTKTNSQEQLAMQASSSLPQLLDDHNEPYCVVDFDLSTGSHGYNHYLHRVNVCLQRYKWRRLSCALLVAEKEGAWGTGKEFEALEKSNVAKTQLQEALDIVDVLLRSAPGNSKVAPAPATKKKEGAWGTGKEFEALKMSNIAKTQLQEALDIVDVLLRSAAGNSKVAPAPATKRAAGVKLADTDNCNIKNRLEPHAMKGGSKILPDSVNGATTQTHLDHPLNMTEMEALQDLVEHGTKMDEKNGGTKLKGAARKMAAA